MNCFQIPPRVLCAENNNKIRTAAEIYFAEKVSPLLRRALVCVLRFYGRWPVVLCEKAVNSKLN